MSIISLQRITLSIVMVSLLFGAQWVMASTEAVDTPSAVEISLWLNGEPYEAEQVVELSEGQGVLEIPESHLLTFALEPVADPFAPEGSVWLTVDVSTWDSSTQAWAHVTDALLGAPLGQAVEMSLSRADGEATPESAEIYLIATVLSEGR